MQEKLVENLYTQENQHPIPSRGKAIDWESQEREHPRETSTSNTPSRVGGEVEPRGDLPSDCPMRRSD
jgi:hypothetical protein